MKKIRVLYTIPNFDTAGSGKVVYDLAKNIDKNLFDIEIACSHDKGKFFKLVEELGLKIHILDTTTSYKPYATLPFRLQKIRKFFKENKYDVIHSWHWSSDWTEALAAKMAGVKWIYTKKAMSWGSPKHWGIRSKLSSFITILNPDMKEQYFKGYKNVRLLPLGLDTNHYHFQEKKYEVDNLSFTQDDFVVISVVNLTKAKGMEVLVDAIKILNDKNVKLLVVGDYNSDYGRSIYQKVQDEGLSDTIKLTGKVLDVRSYLAVSDVFVTPTNVNWEGMPMAPVEAMSSGRIVIGTDTAGINYILEGFEEFLVPPNDAKAIADKIAVVKAMPINKRLEKTQAIRDKVCREYSIENFCNNYQNLYKELCS
jgi:glycosyltransferase involved in cell wall biosynthesis